MSETKTYTAADIDLNDKRIGMIGMAFALTALTQPAKSGNKDHDARSIIANVLTWFESMGLDITLREDAK